MTTELRTVGGLEIVAVRDARGPFLGWTEAFPDAGEQAWALARQADPEAFGADEKWWLPFRCFAIRGAGGSVTLVDTGIGPAESPANAWAPVPGRLPAALAEAGIDVADVGTVVLTHLHTDHCGWAVGADGAPTFPNARYVLQRTETAWLESRTSDPLLSWVVRPLRAAGQLAEVDGPAVLATAPGGETVTVTPTPGHTPGHQSVVVAGGGAEVIVTGDVLVHAVQLVVPETAYVYEEDQEQARATRLALLERGAELATPHLTEPFVKPAVRST